MSQYTEYPWDVHDLKTGKYCLKETLTWEIGKKGSNYFYDIPKGYIFDVSIPWAFSIFLSRHDQRFLKAAALHDHMLEFGWSVETAAGEFYIALRADGVSRYTAKIMYLGIVAWFAFIRRDKYRTRLEGILDGTKNKTPIS